MAPVDTTRTHADAHLEQRQVREETALLVQQKDTLQREILTLQASVNSLNAVIKATHGAELTSREFADKYAAELRAEREILRKDVDGLTRQKEDRNAELRSLEVTVAEKTATVAALERQKGEMEEVVATKRNDAQVAVTEHELTMSRHQDELAGVHAQLTDAKSALASVQKEHDDKKEWLASEDLRLQTKERDLAIYEDRIRRAAAQLTPPMDIHV